MPTTKTTTCCVLCDSTNIEIRHDRKTHYRYLKQDHVLEGQEHTVCRDCGTSFFQDGQIERNNERFLAFAKGIVKHIAPWEIHSIREEYDLSQEQACRIFQCGSKTQFSKWERGEVAPTGTAALTLREALENPEYMKKLARQAGVPVNVANETQSPPVVSAATAELNISDYREFMQALMKSFDDASFSGTDLVTWDPSLARITQPGAHTDIAYYIYDAAKARKRPEPNLYSLLSMVTRVEGTYAIPSNLMEYDIEQHAAATLWLNAPANVPMLRTPKVETKKTAKRTPLKEAPQ